jgi:hypothetical protein
LCADAQQTGQAVRRVLLQLLCDANAISSAFEAALEHLTNDPAFAALKAEAGEGAVDVEGNVMPERELSHVAEELRQGLSVGTNAALERMLQVLILLFGLLSPCWVPR